MKRITKTVNVQNILTHARRWLMAGAMLALTASPSHGESSIPPEVIEALQNVTAKLGTAGTFAYTGATIGWSFLVNAIDGLNVTRLGYYDLNGDGFGESHQVGIWDDEGQLINSVTVTTNDPLLNGFRYTPTDSFLLHYGQTYVIGAYHSEKVDNYLSTYGTVSLENWAIAPQITYAGSRITFGPSFVEPTLARSLVGRFGPNFQFTLAETPEPGTALLLGLALAGFGATARLRARATA